MLGQVGAAKCSGNFSDVNISLSVVFSRETNVHFGMHIKLRDGMEGTFTLHKAAVHQRMLGNELMFPVWCVIISSTFLTFNRN